MSVARCMQEVDAEEFIDWQAHFLANEWGEDRADRRCAVLGWLIALYGSHGQTKITPEWLMEFLHPTGEAKPAQPVGKKIKAHMQALSALKRM